MSGRSRYLDFGVAEWFRPGEESRVLRALDDLEAFGARWLRTHLSWAEYHTPEGPDWYDWLIPTLAQRVELLPCLHYTPPSLSRTGTSAGPPRRLRDFADFVDQVLDRYGTHLRHVELWNEPNNLLDWDWRADPGWKLYSEMITDAAYWSQHRGWPVVLGGPAPFDLNWLDMMGQRGIFNLVSAVSVHGFPGTWDSEAAVWRGWASHLGELRVLLDKYNPSLEVWITEAGYATWRYDQLEQARRFLDALDAPAERLYWYGLVDLPTDTQIQEGRQFDIRHYHMGLQDARGHDKLLARLLRTGGVPEVRRKVDLASRARPRSADPILITGGAGFLGSNLADSLLSDGAEVIIFDNLSRSGVSANVERLKARHGRRAVFQAADIRDTDALSTAAHAASAVYHLAGQVAVTESLTAPLDDFAINAAATVELLEILRRKDKPTPLVFASTNKVYGELRDIALEATAAGYRPVDPKLRDHGLDESRPLELSTPYGCSKGTAEQYVLDYAASFGLPTAAMRMSCVYGPQQFGTEDQGWIAHLLVRAIEQRPITIFGDGHQVRDILQVDDAVAAYRQVMDHIQSVRGTAFNLGGGPSNAVSLLTVLDHFEKLLGHPVERRFAPPRPSDQRYFVADTRRLRQATGWRPAIAWQDGLVDLHNWLRGGEATTPVHQIERSLTA